VATLALAVVAHVWFVRAPETPRPALPVAAPLSVTEVAAAPASRAVDPARVRIDVHTITIPPVSTPPTLRPDRARPSAPLLAGGARVVPASLVADAEAGTRTTPDRESPAPAPDSRGLLPRVQPEPAAVTLESDAPDVAGPTASQASARHAPMEDMHVVPPGEALAAAPVPAVVTLPSPMAMAAARPRGPAGRPPDTVDDAERQERRVREVLDRYTRAYEALDVRAVKAVYPSMDTRELNRAFRGLDSQELDFADCRMSITDRDARARCSGSATYRPKVGSRMVQVSGREWTFDLARSEAGWQIVKANIVKANID
jgi:hypothetical protein